MRNLFFSFFMTASSIMASFSQRVEDLPEIVKDNRLDELKAVLKADPKAAKREFKGSDGTFYLLHVAAQNGHTEAVRILLQAGADPNVYDAIHQSSPLHYACSQNHAEIIRMLVENKADVKPLNGIGFTPLHYVSGSDLPSDILNLLIQHGADINAPDLFGRTPLMTAADRGNLEHVRLLVSLGADTRLKDSEGNTATELAKNSGHAAIADFLSDFGK